MVAKSKTSSKSKKTVSKKTQKVGGGKVKVVKKNAKNAKNAKKSVSKKTQSAGKKQTKVAKKTTTKKTTSETKNSTPRYFKVVYENGQPKGRFSGTKPKQAANKALTSILKTRESDGKSTTTKIKFSIIECTRGSKHKEYNYVGERVKLDKPMEVTIGKGANAKTIKYRYNNKVFKDKVA
jgi:hypothetical protein